VKVAAVTKTNAKISLKMWRKSCFFMILFKYAQSGLQG